MKTKSIKIPKELYLGFVCATAALATYPNVEALIEQTLEDSLREIVRDQRAIATCIENHINRYCEKKYGN